MKKLYLASKRCDLLRFTIIEVNKIGLIILYNCVYKIISPILYVAIYQTYRIK